jgi:hypothetical protein
MLRRARKKAGLVASYTLKCRRDGRQGRSLPDLQHEALAEGTPSVPPLPRLRHMAETLMLEAADPGA